LRNKKISPIKGLIASLSTLFAAIKPATDDLHGKEKRQCKEDIENIAKPRLRKRGISFKRFK
jgi:hypothetical protein